VAFEDPTRHPLLVLSDLAAVGTVGATIMGWLPAVAAVFSIVWLALQIWSDRTVQDWLKRRRQNKVARLQRVLDKLRERDQAGRPS
jgi:hypothetical protein